jgi:hypothetical protein
MTAAKAVQFPSCRLLRSSCKLAHCSTVVESAGADRMRFGIRYNHMEHHSGRIAGPTTRYCLLLTCLAGFLVFIELSRADDELWKNCSTPTTDYVLQVPGSLVRSTGPGITDCTYQSTDGEFNVEAAEQTDSQTLDARMQKELDLLKGTVTDRKKGDNWFALTGVTADGTEFYRLHYTNGTQWVTLRTYPHSKAKKYDRWVTRIDKAFVPFAKKETKESANTDH